MTEVGRQTRQHLLLGLDYLKSTRSFAQSSVFDIFHFIEVYRIGKSLLYVHQNLLQKSMGKNGFQSLHKEALFGGVLASCFECQFLGLQFNGAERKTSSFLIFLDGKSFDQWAREVKLLVDLLPFISQFRKSYKDMLAQGLLRDEFYLNYNVSEIDFEAPYSFGFY